MGSQQVQIHQQQQQGTDQEAATGSKSGSGPSSFMCRQSSTRWTPTTDQIRILKDLYYNNGVRSPSAEQIQRISAKLRQYGKIEGKNVFYWFQNHKARERQKKRLFTADMIPVHHRSMAAASGPSMWRNDHHQDHLFHHQHLSPVCNKLTNNNIGYFPASSGSCSPLSPGIVTVGAYGGYGSSSSSSMAMEKSFRECSITPNGGSSMGHNFTWIGPDPYTCPSPYPFLDKRKYTSNGSDDHQSTLEMEEEEENSAPEIETLPLFPMHGQDMIKQQETTDCFSGWHRRGADNAVSAAGSRASLELTLNSYDARFPNSP